MHSLYRGGEASRISRGELRPRLYGEVRLRSSTAHGLQTGHPIVSKHTALVARSGRKDGDQERTVTRRHLLLEIAVQLLVGCPGEPDDGAGLIAGGTAEQAINRRLGSFSKNVEQGDVQAASHRGRHQPVHGLIRRCGAPGQGLVGRLEVRGGKLVALSVSNQACARSHLENGVGAHLKSAYFGNQMLVSRNRCWGWSLRKP